MTAPVKIGCGRDGCAECSGRNYKEIEAWGAMARKMNKMEELMQVKGTPWGGWQVVAQGKGYKVKLLTILPNHRFSLQKHSQRSETWHIVSGRGIATRGDVEFRLLAGEDFYIPQGAKHRLKNIGQTDMLVVEIQNGEKLNEEDITRIEDDYGRADA